MPFADKFRALVDMPFRGDTLGDLTVESVEVSHVGLAAGQYVYPLRLVLHGRGGEAAVERAIKSLFARRCATFSGYGTPYQLWFGKPTIESLGDGRYALTAQGGGARVHLAADLARFGEHLAAQGLLAATATEQTALVEQYRAEVQRLVGRYRARLHQAKNGYEPSWLASAQNARNTWAAILGVRVRVNTPFMFIPPTRITLCTAAKSARFQTCIPATKGLLAATCK